MAKHIHAENMALYAQDAMETPRPWERWQYQTESMQEGDVWNNCFPNLSFDGSYKYRRKPKMLSVTLANGEVVSWPEPHRTELEYGDLYFYVDVDGSVMVEEWDCIAWDSDTLSNGWIHLTEDAAEKHATALRKINTQGHGDG